MERRLAEIHIIRARRSALHLFAFTSSVFPSEWNKSYIEEIVPELLEFAFHARRVNQLCELDKFQFPRIDKFLVTFDSGPDEWETRYQNALNRVLHARKFVFGNAQADHRKIFLKAEDNLSPLYVRIETDQREFASVSLYGFVDCFLSAVIPEIKKRFPDFQF
jgi:hypothetical protein